MTDDARVYNFPTVVSNVPRQSIPKQTARKSVKMYYWKNKLVIANSENENSVVSNPHPNDYNKRTSKKARVVVGHARLGTKISSIEVGGETEMSDQMDRKQIEDLLAKELTNHAEKSQLKLEAMTSEMNMSIQSIEHSLSQKFESMNSTLASTLQELKYSNELLKKDIDQHVLNTEASNRANLHEVKQLIDNERNEERRERKTDRRYMITTIIATFAGAAAFAKLFL